MCLCPKNLSGGVFETMTCQEFLIYARKLYNAHLERKRID